jgi:hypothetical protein
MQLQGGKPIGLWLSTQTITQKKTSFKHDYMLHNHILEPVTSAKYLGVTLQSNLKWNTHIDNITSNGNKSLGCLKRNLQISNPEVKSRLSDGEYCTCIWVESHKPIGFPPRRL